MKIKTNSQPTGLQLDLKIAFLLAEQALYNGGFRVIASALKGSSDPGQVIGTFLMHLGQHIMTEMPKDVQLSPAILLAKGGWVEQVSDLIMEKLKVPKQIMDKAEIFVASTASHMAQAQQQKAGGSINGVQAPPAASPGNPQPVPTMPQGAQ